MSKIQNIDAFSRHEIVAFIRTAMAEGYSEQDAVEACKSTHPEGPDVVQAAWSQVCADVAAIKALRNAR